MDKKLHKALQTVACVMTPETGAQDAFLVIKQRIAELEAENKKDVNEFLEILHEKEHKIERLERELAERHALWAKADYENTELKTANNLLRMPKYSLKRELAELKCVTEWQKTAIEERDRQLAELQEKLSESVPWDLMCTNCIFMLWDGGGCSCEKTGMRDIDVTKETCPLKEGA